MIVHSLKDPKDPNPRDQKPMARAALTLIFFPKTIKHHSILCYQMTNLAIRESFITTHNLNKAGIAALFFFKTLIYFLSSIVHLRNRFSPGFVFMRVFEKCIVITIPVVINKFSCKGTFPMRNGRR